MKHILEADSIQLSFGRRKILSDIFIRCETGKIVALLGRNGSGKSSLMQIIYGSLSAEKSVLFDKISKTQAFKQPQYIRFLPQFNFIPKNILLHRVFKNFEVDMSEFENLFPELKNQHNKRLVEFSGGERRMIEVYVILKSKTQFILLDEPFTHISPVHIEKIKQILRQEKNNKGILITDHLYVHTTAIADDIYLLNDGKITLVKNFKDIEALGYANL